MYALTQTKLAGCSSHSLAGDFSGNIRPVLKTENNFDRCIGQPGAAVHASCCHAPSLECKVQEYSSLEHTGKIMVTCDGGWTLTGCNAQSHGSHPLGAYSVDNTCVVMSSPGSHRTAAVAICCRKRLLETEKHSSTYK
ncbi:hypothetical protein JD844_017925 [Phrynosoma platyrhinos]|uniref:Uncharacterized protein n=1 Tax=Phrynosoma platyrhinos TaxID=52577 RepID=A0ABQ7SMP6_PHRPL|nr:hypothetical protein JD844_017925 [Phrynosoma platyrhinos]